MVPRHASSLLSEQMCSENGVCGIPDIKINIETPRGYCRDVPRDPSQPGDVRHGATCLSAQLTEADEIWLIC